MKLDYYCKKNYFCSAFHVLERVLLAGVAELVDALDLGSSELVRVGSSPIARTTRQHFRVLSFLFLRN